MEKKSISEMNILEVVIQLYELGYYRYTINGNISGCVCRIWKEDGGIIDSIVTDDLPTPDIALRQALFLAEQEKKQ